MKTILMNETYHGEGTVDLVKDVDYVVEQHEQNNLNEHGFLRGAYKVTIEYLEDD